MNPSLMPTVFSTLSASARAVFIIGVDRRSGFRMMLMLVAVLLMCVFLLVTRSSSFEKSVVSSDSLETDSL